MSTYVDTSALLMRYVEEADPAAAEGLLRADHALLTGPVGPGNPDSRSDQPSMIG